MTREELEHAIRAACDVANDTAVYVFGSQAILGQYPDAPATLRQSVEVDMSPRNHPENVDRIDGALGELSQFHDTFGFYVHGVPIDEAATLSPGWRERTIDVAVEGGKLGLCLEGHDLAASKLVAFRDKDRDFVRVLLAERMIASNKLLARLRTLGLADEERERRIQWVRRTAQELRKEP